MCKCFSSASVGTVFEHLLRHRLQVLLLRQRGLRVRAPLAAACGTVCKCFNSASAVCKCFSSASVGTVFEPL